MKKILSVLAILLAVVLFSSCNSFERKAKKQLRETINELAKNPDSYKIVNEKVVFSNDSVCVISFVGKGENGFGGYTSNRREYYLTKRHVKGEVKVEEALLNLDDEDEYNTPFKKEVDRLYNDKDLRKSLIEKCKKQNIDFSKEGKNVASVSLATIITSIQGREVYTDD